MKKINLILKKDWTGDDREGGGNINQGREKRVFFRN
jgi:hypothetical protein